MADLLGIDRRINKQNEQYKSLQTSGSEYRLRRLSGELTDSKGNYSQFNQKNINSFLMHHLKLAIDVATL